MARSMSIKKKGILESEKKKPIAEVRKENEKLKERVEKLENSCWCYVCGKIKTRDHFYVSTDPIVKSGLAPVCKECVRSISEREDANHELHEPTKDSLKKALQYLNKPYLESVWDASMEESNNLNSGQVKTNVARAYFKNISMGQYNGKTYKDSDMFKETIVYDDEKTPQELVEEHNGQDTYDSYLKNKQDVIRLLDYDPFEEEPIKDQPFLYSQLLGMLDASEDANEDMMRVSSAIQIVRGFLQQSKIDNAIAKLMGDVTAVQENSGTIKSLQDSKQKLTSMITNLAAESCLSLKNSKTKTKGEDTWTGHIRKLKELGLRESEVNGFDIETSRAMRQVMDESHKSILQELKLDESEWASMVADQRDMIYQMRKELSHYKEISRILLRENLDLKDFIEDQDIEYGEQLVDLNQLFYTESYSEGSEEDG